jgi:hypothetical protein
LGLCFFFSARGKRHRAFGWAYLIALAFFVVSRGKDYYLAPAYTVLFSAGGVQAEHLLSRFPRQALLRGGLVSVLAFGGIYNGLFALPVLPLETSDRLIGNVFGSFVEPGVLTREFHSQYGGEELAEKVDAAYLSLSEEDRKLCTVLMLKYSQASAVNFFGRADELPRAVSGHMNYFLWGPDHGRGEVAIASGFTMERLKQVYDDVREVDRVHHPLATSEYNDLPIYVCRNPTNSLAATWPTFKRYSHTRLAWRDVSPDR